MPIASSPLYQAAWVVNDLEAAIHRWVRTAKAGPFYVIPHVPYTHGTYRGRPSTVDFSAAIAQSGGMQIELIQQHDVGPSVYRDVFRPGEEGFHHLCAIISVDEFEAEIARYDAEDCPAVARAAFGELRYAYFDTRARLGHMMEIIEDRPALRATLRLLAEAAADWDGRDPIRYF
jgi:hypothetical protein